MSAPTPEEHAHYVTTRFFYLTVTQVMITWISSAILEFA